MHILAEFTPWDPVGATRPTVRACSAQDRNITGLNGVKWWPAISVKPALSMKLFDGDFSSDLEPGDVSMTILVDKIVKGDANAGRYRWAAAKMTLYAGNSGDAWPWTIVFQGLVDRFEADGNRLKLTGSVDTEPFDTNALTANYAGTGGAEGGADLKNTPKPWLFGRCSNCEPVLIDSVNNVYQFSSYGPIQAVNTLYERANDFGAAVADYATYAALVAATIKPGQWATSLATGLIRLGAPAYGVITGDVDGDKPSGTWLRKTGEIVQRIASNAGISGTLVDSTSWNALDTALVTLLPSDGRIGLYLTEQTSVIDIARRLARPCNAQAGVSWLGKLFAVRVAVGTPAVTLDAQGRQRPYVTSSTEVDVSPPYWRIEMGAERCWRVQTYDEIATYAPLIDMGAYSGSATYREGNIVQDQSISWLYINPAASSGNAPPTLPTTSNSYWKAMDSKLGTVSPGATTDLDLTSIGSTVATVVGNTIVRASGTADYNACAIGTPMLGAAYAEVDIPASNLAIVSLDNDATSTALASMDIMVQAGVSLGVAIYMANTLVYSASPTVVAGQKLGVGYDGVRFRVYLNAVQQGTDFTAAAALRLWPKWHSYTAAITLTGLRQMTNTSNLWGDIGGANVPAPNATSGDNLIPDAYITRGLSGTYWYVPGSVVAATLPAALGAYTTGVRFPAGATSDSVGPAAGINDLPATKRLWASAWVYVTKPGGGGTNPQINCSIDYVTAAGVYISSASAFGLNASTFTLSTWTYVEGYMDVPSNAAKGALNFYLFNSHADWDIYMTGLRVSKSQGGSDVTAEAQIAPTAALDQTVYYDYTGTAKSGQLTRALTNYLKKGGVDVSSSATWSFTPSGCTVTAGSNGVVTLNTVSASNASIFVSATYASKAYTWTIQITKVQDDPPSGGTGATSFMVGVSGTVNQTSYSSPVVIGTGTMLSNGSGQARLAGTVDYQMISSGTGSVDIKAQRSLAGANTWSDAGVSATGTTSTGPSGALDDFGTAGSAVINALATGLTASTAYDFRLIAKYNTTALDVSGSFSGAQS